jgi:hypothetical protein
MSSDTAPPAVSCAPVITAVWPWLPVIAPVLLPSGAAASVVVGLPPVGP